jgi:hypothetical protein
MTARKDTGSKRPRDPNEDQRPTERPVDDFDRDLEQDNHRATESHTMEELTHPGANPGSGTEPHMPPDLQAGRQHARRGEAESPRELTLNQPEKKKKRGGRS